MFALDEVQSTQNTLVQQTTPGDKLQFASHVCLCFVVKNNLGVFFGHVTLKRDIVNPHSLQSVCILVVSLACADIGVCINS